MTEAANELNLGPEDWKLLPFVAMAIPFQNWEVGKYTGVPDQKDVAPWGKKVKSCLTKMPRFYHIVKRQENQVRTTSHARPRDLDTTPGLCACERRL